MGAFDITISAATDPIAEEDTYSVLPNTSIILQVLSNDFLGTEPTVLTVEIAPSNGTATVTVGGDEIEYTPSVGFTGEDAFYYRITDDNSNYDIAKVNITVG